MLKLLGNSEQLIEKNPDYLPLNARMQKLTIKTGM